MNSKLNFELGRFATGRYRNRSGPVTPVTAVSGPVPVGKKTLVHTKLQTLSSLGESSTFVRRACVFSFALFVASDHALLSFVEN